MTPKTICVLGGTGFVGHHLISQLTKAGYYVVAPSRNRERRRSLSVLPKVDVVDADIHDEEALKALFVGCHAVVNLVGIINEFKRGDFQRNHVELVQKVVDACKATGVTRLLQMSALNADAEQGSSAYLRSKGEGEDLAHASGLEVTSFRPSIMFGHDDHFFNKFALMLRYLPVLPLVCADSRFAPVHVSDVVEVMVKSLNDKESFNQRYDLCGPEAYSMLDMVEYVNRISGFNRFILPLGPGLSALMARVMGVMPFKPFSYDNYLSLQTPALCVAPFPARFGIEPSRIEPIISKFIGHESLNGRYDTIRQHAARDEEQ
ncbi:MAG: complex I NDUFA9 subunit family protein [Pseudomonadota bacterium]|nr:complex I NDUFA9 subunit family protein [Pseudomonadota bacterium]